MKRVSVEVPLRSLQLKLTWVGTPFSIDKLTWNLLLSVDL
ncbi:Uncharacterised protein [Vibrio cholerae]|nr:Uncharacterised protein [Vibrio cholerae]CSI68952.1 Uncharacterised protein [Vibrio cholerae]